ncbi:GTPase [Halomonas sp. PAMB 3264]|uniref:YcjF family protein n=1 Tax=Halomonas sp. PAMB 3264 TaxID=3075222 RepID=UPI00289976F4|nr:GTPase [Halomonas sp. PAMB 3264]WNL43529.1 GTPase [Halomonas sp. PAMB 3264]
MEKRDEYDFGGQFSEEFNKLRRDIKRPNILVMGATGAGKSSVVNLVFGQELAAVGAGKPVTEGVLAYENQLVRIYDSEGYESGQQQQERFKSHVLNFIKEKESDLTARVHLVWYCISQANHRVFDIDLETVRAVAAMQVPLAVVMTQADQVSESDSAQMLATVRDNCPGVTIFEISTNPDVGLTVDPLIQWAHDNLSEALRIGFISASKKAIKLKRRESHKIVAQHSATAAAMGASPIPFSDAPLLVGNQMAMLARLASIWDLPGLQTVAGGGAFGMLVSQLGRTLAGNLAKAIPGVGSWVGGAMNASVASALTGAIGYAITEICEQVVTDELKGGRMKELSEYFNTEIMAEMVKQAMRRGVANA